MVRENSFVEAFNYVKEMDSMRENKIKQKLEKSIQEHKDMINSINNIRDSREQKLRNHSKLLEDCKNEALGTIIKAIYIEALEPGSLTDNGIVLAESLVDSWIQSKGGASRIIALNRNKTYLLNRLCNIAEEAALMEAEEVENAEKTEEEKTEETAEQEKKNKVSELMAQAQELIAKATAIQNGADVNDNASDLDDEDNLDSVSADDMEADNNSEEAPADNNTEGEETSDDSEEPAPEEDAGEEEKSEEEEPAEDTEEEPSEDEESEEPDESEESEDIDDDDEDDDFDGDLDDEDEDDDDNEDEEGEESDDLEDEDFESDESEDEDIDSLDDEDTESTEDEESSADDMESEDIGDEEDEENFDDVESSGEEEDVEDDGSEDGSDIADMDDTNPVTVDGEDEDGEPASKGKIFDELEDEEDVKKAVEIISQRVADAEEDFVKRNAEDKKKIDDLIGKISDNIKTVEKISDNDDPKSKVAEESVRMYNRQIKDITENRPMKVFEKMVRKLSESALKDAVLKETYTLENGKLDVGGIIESAKVMYGFLETLNTLQLEKVDKEYVANVIKEL